MVSHCWQLNLFGFFCQAYPRAEQEEADCNRKASSRMLYLNLVVNTIKRLRNEAAEAAKAGVKVPPQDRQKNLLTTHMQVSFILMAAGDLATNSHVSF